MLEVRFRDYGECATLCAAQMEVQRHGATELRLIHREPVHLRTIVDAAPVPMLISRASDGLILHANALLAEALGLPGKSVVGRRTTDFYDTAERRALLERIEKRGNVRGLEVRARWPDGTHRWVIASIERSLFEGEAALVAGFQDITERKQAEEALRESEAKWRSLTENAPDFIASVDDDGTILATNRTVAGYSTADVVGKTVYDFIPAEHHDRVRQALRGVFQMGTAGPIEIAGVGASGMWSQYEVRLGPIVRSGGVAATTWIARDITERKAVEEALRVSEERYRGVVEDMPGLICCYLPGGEMTFVNEAYCEYFAKTLEELVGSNFLSLIPEEDRETVMANISALTVDSPTQSHEHQVITPAGDIRWQRWTNRALFDAQGKVVAYQSIGEDITERKRAEQALMDAREALDSRVERAAKRGNVYGLTFRELTVLELVSTGRSDRDIATVLGIRHRTVNKHVENIRRRMKAASRTEAGYRAITEELLDQEPSPGQTTTL